jgi:hypothetical protein
MTTYTVLFAEDVPHYGFAEIEADDDQEAIEKARAYWDEHAEARQPLTRTGAIRSATGLSA